VYNIAIDRKIPSLNEWQHANCTLYQILTCQFWTGNERNQNTGIILFKKNSSFLLCKFMVILIGIKIFLISSWSPFISNVLMSCYWKVNTIYHHSLLLEFFLFIQLTKKLLCIFYSFLQKKCRSRYTLLCQ
jgi:hypothetical protein